MSAQEKSCDFQDDEQEYPEGISELNVMKFEGGEVIEIQEIKEKLKTIVQLPVIISKIDENFK